MNNLLWISIVSKPEPMGMHVLLMIVFIISILMALGILITLIYQTVEDIKRNSFDFWNTFGGTISFILCIALVFLSGALTTNYNSRKQKYNKWYATEYEEVAYNKIYSLDLQSELTGRFFILGSGKIDTDNYYYFYIKNDKGLYQFTKLKCNNDVFIKEVDESPKIIQKKDKDSEFIYYIIYVPVGTVVDSDYKVM